MGNIFFERFAALCKEIGETPNSVAKILGVSSGSVTAWKNGTEPRNRTLSNIADYFGVSTDYLLGKETEKLQKNNALDELVLTEDEIRILAAIRAMSPERQKALADLLGIEGP